MTQYSVQFTMPCENPMMNVSANRSKWRWIFEVPINYPDAHKMGFADLVAAAELSGKFTVYTPHKNKSGSTEKSTSSKA